MMIESEDITFDDLQEAIDGDTSNDRIKDLAELFLSAMKDWPTADQIRLAEFVKELKDYYGNPLTSNKIENKKRDLINENDIWRSAAGSSIVEMIDISARFEKEGDFDHIFGRLIDYCQK